MLKAFCRRMVGEAVRPEESRGIIRPEKIALNKSNRIKTRQLNPISGSDREIIIIIKLHGMCINIGIYGVYHR